jgi:hypothetical protein
MLYLHVIDTTKDIGNVKSMLIEDNDAYKLGKLISNNEVDNIIIINEIIIDKKNINKRKMNILNVFLNGKEDLEYSQKLKINKKNT